MRDLDIKPYILSDENELYVINKPPALPTTGRSLDDDDCMQFHLIRHHGSMVWSLNQLDADTSGLCFFTTRKANVQLIKALWSTPKTIKEYIAVIHGCPEWNEFEVDAPVGKDSSGTLGVHPSGKHARTRFEVLDRNERFSLLRIQLFTGRTHQIRIHLQHLGFSLVGEEWYRETPCTLHPRQALHAHRLEFPKDSQLPTKYFTAPVPEDLQRLMDQLSLESKRINDKKSSSP
ncbi:MAG: RluA family pseudouridine synthase [Opitutaceae bacterium]